MPQSPKSAPAAGAGKEAPSFEEALKKLEAIVEAMESGELPLETMLAKFEEGTRLVALCQTRLAEAELKIQKLEKSAGGALGLKPLEPGAPEADA